MSSVIRLFELFFFVDYKILTKIIKPGRYIGPKSLRLWEVIIELDLLEPCIAKSSEAAPVDTQLNIINTNIKSYLDRALYSRPP